jgi:hypothetical protein
VAEWDCCKDGRCKKCGGDVEDYDAPDKCVCGQHHVLPKINPLKRQTETK